MAPDVTSLIESIASDIAALCAGPDRQPGTAQNRAATDYAIGVLRATGAVVTVLPFEVPEWIAGSATLDVAGLTYPLHPGPYSAAVAHTTNLVTAATVEDLGLLREEARDAVILLHGDIAREQLTPRAYPWYSNPAHAAIYVTLESLAPAAIIAATGKNPAMTAAREPFPLIEDPAFPIPTAYCALAEGDALLSHAGDVVRVEIDSSVRPSSGVQPVARIGRGTSGRRIIVAGHLDSTWGSPGALDNAAGAVTAISVARLLAADPPSASVEIVPFNGEDHATSPGEVAYLDANPDGFGDVALMINVDGSGFRGSPAALSSYGVSAQIDAVIDAVLADFPDIDRGPEWFASDHAIFAMRGVPSLAITSRDFGDLWESIAHTTHDVADNLDYELIAQVAFAIEKIIRQVDALD
ncbi:MAG TPA: M28 family peptidase [Coriobacteriia bacterium]|nr:M28 family peptidase [Coriobacteriia bacterium]